MTEINSEYRCLLTLAGNDQISACSGDILPLLGYTCREIKGRSLAHWIEPSNPEIVTTQLFTALQQKQSWFGILRIPLRNNQLSYFYVFLQPEVTSEGDQQTIMTLSAVDTVDQQQIAPIFDKPLRFQLSRLMARITRLWQWLFIPLVMAAIILLFIEGYASYAVGSSLIVISLMHIVHHRRQHKSIHRLLNFYHPQLSVDPFTLYLFTGRHDIWAHVYHLFEHIQQPLRLALQQSEHVASEISQAAQDGFAAATTVAHRCRKDRSGVTAVVDAVEQIHASIELLTTDLCFTKSKLQQLSDLGNCASAVNLRSQYSIKRQRASTQTMADTVASIINDVKSVSEVLLIIGEVAEKTNLSTLNACIEAARLGDQGSEISNLAMTVREFAQSSQQNTQSLQQVINTINHNARNALTDINKFQQQLESDQDQLLQSQKDWSAMLDIVEQVTKKTTSMSESVKRQVLFSGDIDGNLGVLAGLSNASLEQTHNASLSYRGIQQRAEGLNVLVGQMSAKH